MARSPHIMFVALGSSIACQGQRSARRMTMRRRTAPFLNQHRQELQSTGGR